MNEDNIYDLFCLTEIEIWQTRCLTEHSSDSKTKPEHISIPFLVSDFPPNLVDSEYFFLFRFVYIIHCSLSTHFRQMFNLTFFFFFFLLFLFLQQYFISIVCLSSHFRLFFSIFSNILSPCFYSGFNSLFISPRHWFYFIFLSLFFLLHGSLCSCFIEIFFRLI